MKAKKKKDGTIDMRTVKYDKFLVCERESRVPMMFTGDQFTWATLRDPAGIYTKKEANRLIRKSEDFRSQLKCSTTEYVLIPLFI